MPSNQTLVDYEERVLKFSADMIARGYFIKKVGTGCAIEDGVKRPLTDAMQGD